MLDQRIETERVLRRRQRAAVGVEQFQTEIGDAVVLVLPVKVERKRRDRRDQLLSRFAGEANAVDVCLRIDLSVEYDRRRFRQLIVRFDPTDKLSAD